MYLNESDGPIPRVNQGYETSSGSGSSINGTKHHDDLEYPNLSGRKLAVNQIPNSHRLPISSGFKGLSNFENYPNNMLPQPELQRKNTAPAQNSGL